MGCCSSNYKYTQYKPNVDEVASIDGMKETLVRGYIRNSIQELLPYDVETLCIHYFGIYGVDGHLVVEQNDTVTLKQSKYKFDSLLIKENAILTGTQCTPLYIMCFGDVTLEQNAKMDLDGMGYAGGRSGGGTGESYNDGCCHGGGGGDGGSGNCPGGGGYGGYGGCHPCCWCCCCFCSCIFFGCGGCTYGDKELTTLHLGSGGGGGYKRYHNNIGGNGGGAIRLQCFGRIILKEGATITCNGGNGKRSDMDGGGGSGGSIHIIINDKNSLQMHTTSMISAKGGYKRGGVGRIRIDFWRRNKNNTFNDEYRIIPRPYIGSINS